MKIRLGRNRKFRQKSQNLKQKIAFQKILFQTVPVTTQNTTERYITAKDIKNGPKKFSNFAHFCQIATKWVKNFYVNKK